MWLVSAVVALIVALAVAGFVDMDDAKQRSPLYETPTKVEP